MFNFDNELTPEQNEVRDTAMKFALKEMRPMAHELDSESKFPVDIIRKAWELGLINTCIGEEFGGAGFNHETATIITECLAYGCMGINTSIMANDLALLPIVLGGSPEQKKKILPDFTNNFKFASFCLTEPSNGSDAGGIQTQIKIEGDQVTINGSKMWITNAGFADLYVVFGTINSSLKHKGITAVIVEKGTSGLSVGQPEKKMGHRCSDTRAMTFTNVKVPISNLIGKPGQGWEIAMRTLDNSRPIIAASALGGAQAALDHSLAYSKERKQFGTSISNHQAIQMMLAEMAMKVESARQLVRKSARLLDNKVSNTIFASMAKCYSSDICMEVATNAVQIFGGYGYSVEYPVEKIMRDAKLLQIYEGTSQIQRMVIARELLK
jgi:acyl-CoA dehydrogenase